MTSNTDKHSTCIGYKINLRWKERNNLQELLYNLHPNCLSCKRLVGKVDADSIPPAIYYDECINRVPK